MTQSRNWRSHIMEFYFIVCIVGLVMVLWFSLFGTGGFRDLQKAQLELAAARIRTARLQDDIQRRRENIEALRSDPQTQEQKARQNGFAHKDEIIQILP